MKFLKYSFKTVFACLILASFVFTYFSYNFIGLTTLTGSSHKVEIECFIEGKEKTIVLNNKESQVYSLSWTSCGFDPYLGAMCYDPAFNITFYTNFGKFTAKGVCFGCNNFSYLYGLVGFIPNNEFNLIKETKKHFPEVFVEK